MFANASGQCNQPHRRLSRSLAEPTWETFCDWCPSQLPSAWLLECARCDTFRWLTLCFRYAALLKYTSWAKMRKVRSETIEPSFGWKWAARGLGQDLGWLNYLATLIIQIYDKEKRGNLLSCGTRLAAPVVQVWVPPRVARAKFCSYSSSFADG